MTKIIDLVGLGALNADYIVRRDQLGDHERQSIERFKDLLDPGIEKSISKAQIEEIISVINPFCEKHLGGSAFNVIHGVASASSGLKLAFIGIEGKKLEGFPNFAETLESLNVETDTIYTIPADTTGRCVSYVRDQVRTLRVNPGANHHILDILNTNKRELNELLSITRLLHITSFLSEGAAQGIAEFVETVSAANRSLGISFDPGYEWCKDYKNDVLRIVKHADYIFLNSLEFDLLGQREPRMSDSDVARRILNDHENNGRLIVLKGSENIVLFSLLGQRIITRQYNIDSLSPSQIVDDTGAGDAFAAGFLIGQLSAKLGTEESVNIGAEFAKSHLKHPGIAAHSYFAGILRDAVLESMEVKIGSETTRKDSTIAPLICPDKVTYKWLRDNVPATLIIQFIALILTLIVLAFTIGNLGAKKWLMEKIQDQPVPIKQSQPPHK